MTQKEKELGIQLTKLKSNINFIANKLGLKPIGDGLEISTWKPGDKKRYQLLRTDSDDLVWWQGYNYTAKEMEAALEVTNSIFKQLIYPLEVNKQNG